MKATVAVVGGASRGAGKGIALALADIGATVYVAARTSRDGPKPSDGAPGTIEDTAEAVTARGGIGIPVRVDLSDQQQTADLFARVEREHGRVDVMANSVWGPNFMPVWNQRFWELSDGLWTETLQTIGACWLTSTYASRLMMKNGRGLIIHVTDNPHPDTSGYRGQILHDLGHELMNRMILDMSMQTKKSNIAVVGLNPGFMRTERVLMAMTSDKAKKQFRFDLSETPEYIGRAVAALVKDKGVMKKNGKLLWACDLAQEYGFTDTDGRFIPRFDPTVPMQAFPC